METKIRCAACGHRVQPVRSYEPNDNGLYDEGGYAYWSCPHCGEEMLTPESAILENILGVTVIVDPKLKGDDWYFWSPDWFDERDYPRRDEPDN